MLSPHQRLIAKQERTPSTTLLNKDQTQNLIKHRKLQSTINQQQIYRLRMDSIEATMGGVGWALYELNSCRRFDKGRNWSEDLVGKLIFCHTYGLVSYLKTQFQRHVCAI